MSLLNRIEDKLQAAPVTPPPKPDNVVDIDRRDSYIKACMGATVAEQEAAAKGLNEATLMAAIKVLCRWPDSEIRKRLGIAEEQEMFTAKEWSNSSQYPTGDTSRQTQTNR